MSQRCKEALVCLVGAAALVAITLPTGPLNLRTLGVVAIGMLVDRAFVVIKYYLTPKEEE